MTTQRWEYKTVVVERVRVKGTPPSAWCIRVKDEVFLRDDYLNQLGDEGWELASAVIALAPGGMMSEPLIHFLYFKRPKP